MNKRNTADDQVERFRFALEMCRSHAQRGFISTEPWRACDLIMQQVDAAFRIEHELRESHDHNSSKA